MQFLKRISHKYRWLGGLAAIMSFCWWAAVYAHQGWQLVHSWL